MAPAKIKGDYLETDTGNKIARRAQLHGTQHIVLGGRVVIQADVCIRGDLVRPKESGAATSPSFTSVSIGRYTFISSGTILCPPLRIHKGMAVYAPLKIGEHVFIASGCVIEAACIGDHVHLERDVVLGKMVIIRDRVKILRGAVLPPGMVVPSGWIVAGTPARLLAELPDGWGVGDDAVEGGDLMDLWRSTGQHVNALKM